MSESTAGKKRKKKKKTAETSSYSAAAAVIALKTEAPPYFPLHLYPQRTSSEGRAAGKDTV